MQSAFSQKVVQFGIRKSVHPPWPALKFKQSWTWAQSLRISFKGVATDPESSDLVKNNESLNLQLGLEMVALQLTDLFRGP